MTPRRPLPCFVAGFVATRLLSRPNPRGGARERRDGDDRRTTREVQRRTTTTTTTTRPPPTPTTQRPQRRRREKTTRGRGKKTTTKTSLGLRRRGRTPREPRKGGAYPRRGGRDASSCGPCPSSPSPWRESRSRRHCRRRRGCCTLGTREACRGGRRCCCCCCFGRGRQCRCRCFPSYPSSTRWRSG